VPFQKPQILEFNLLIINHLIFLLTIILDNSGLKLFHHGLFNLSSLMK
jgi:hypothetical protein